ncbi:MAG: hypothetical protein M3Q44_08010 [bacterium]|nr:hypothetical protein [bacterium]
MTEKDSRFEEALVKAIAAERSAGRPFDLRNRTPDPKLFETIFEEKTVKSNRRRAQTLPSSDFRDKPLLNSRAQEPQSAVRASKTIWIYDTK